MPSATDCIGRRRDERALRDRVRPSEGGRCASGKRFPYRRACDSRSEELSARTRRRGPAMKLDQVESLDWSKGDGLLPAVVQDFRTGKVLMLGYMNREALRATLGEERVTFYSRSKQRLWTKGETSGNFLHLVDAAVDCDDDTILVTANPDGPTCHNGTDSCFGDKIGTTATRLAFLSQL